METFFKRRSDYAALPKQAHFGDAGYDLYAAENYLIPPGAVCMVDTGWDIHLGTSPNIDAFGSWHWVGYVLSRSGLAAKENVSVANAPGCIDASYNGPLRVILRNCSSKDYVVSRGDRVAQLVISHAYVASMIEVGEMPQTDRGKTGFGASGK